MGRVFAIVALVGVFIFSGIARASSGHQVRLPITREGPTSSEAVVAPGDHLWKISARHLGPATTESDIVPYWRKVIEINTPRLRSGDPDLIYPGEIIELP